MDSPHELPAITSHKVAELKPYPTNPRKHSKAQVRQIADSIEAFGFTNPVLVDADGIILAGHGRVQAAKLLKLDDVPTIRLDHLSEAQKKAYIIADNRLAEKSGWDDDILAIELQTLMTLDTGFDITVTGYEMPEIDFKVQALDDTDPDDGDEIPPVPANAVTQSGDLWLLGDHRLLCGNALEAASYDLLMQGDKARMVITDPPYNVPIPGHVSGLGKVKHEDFAMASGEMTRAEFTTFLGNALGLMTANSMDGSLHYVFMDWRHIADLLAAGEGVYAELKNLIVWVKDNGGMGSLYRSRHEMVAVFKHGTAVHLNNIELGRYGRYRTNVWNYRGVNTLRRGREDELAMHPTVKPARMLADAIRDCSHAGDIVLDPFGGSGSTLVAAEQAGRTARLMELEPKYVDVAIERWQALTGGEAVHVDTGRTFKEAKLEVEHE